MSSSWRTSIALVEAIIETDPSIVQPGGSGLSPFIDAANNMVTNLCVIMPANSPDDTKFQYDAGTLELIERWLSAHFYAIRDQRTAMEKAGDVAEEFQYKVGLMLQQTIFGQQAMVLDFHGYLAALQRRLTEGAPPRPGIKYLGRNRKRRGGNWGDYFSDD